MRHLRGGGVHDLGPCRSIPVDPGREGDGRARPETQAVPSLLQAPVLAEPQPLPPGHGMAGIRAETSASGTSYDPRDGGWLVFTWRSQGSHLRAQPKEDTPTGSPGGLDLGVLRMERLPEVGF